jgi:hypothetical protein
MNRIHDVAEAIIEIFAIGYNDGIEAGSQTTVEVSGPGRTVEDR